MFLYGVKLWILDNPMLIEYIPTFNYFSKFVDWKPNYDILDFGSNCGNLLKSGSIINPYRYTGIDVDKDAIEEGKRLFPEAQWISYDRFNPCYNSTGVDVLPTLENNFDLIISYSVFSHMDFEDCEQTVEYLVSKLKPSGRLLFTYCNIDNQRCVEWFRKRRIDCDQIPNTDFIYLINNEISKVNKKQRCEHFVAFYRTAWILEKLKRFNPISHNAYGKWIQDCIEISSPLTPCVVAKDNN